MIPEPVMVILESPLFAISLAFILGALAVSGKFSQNAATFLLFGAWVMGSLALWRGKVREPQIFGGAVLIFAGICLLVNYWIKHDVRPESNDQPPKAIPHAIQVTAKPLLSITSNGSSQPIQFVPIGGSFQDPFDTYGKRPELWYFQTLLVKNGPEHSACDLRASITFENVHGASLLVSNARFLIRDDDGHWPTRINCLEPGESIEIAAAVWSAHFPVHTFKEWSLVGSRTAIGDSLEQGRWVFRVKLTGQNVDQENEFCYECYATHCVDATQPLGDWPRLKA